MKKKRALVVATVVATISTFTLAASTAHAAPSTKKFCDANWKISDVFSSLFEGGDQGPSDAQLEKADAKLAPLLDQAEQSVPADIEPEVTPALTSLRQGFKTALDDPTLQEHGQAIDAWAFDHCKYQAVDVTATEYKFSGIPKKLTAGRTMFKLTNDGAEVHEIGVAHIKTKTPLKTLLSDEKRGDKETEFLGGTGPVAEGDTAYAYVQLPKGRTAAVCFIPVGTTDINSIGSGKPHAAMGMVREFKVS
jgi:hypothetical protein